MKPYRLTISKIQKICKENRYIAVRRCTGGEMGVNCKLAFTKEQEKPNVRTNYISWRPIDFMEYITIKAPFAR